MTHGFGQGYARVSAADRLIRVPEQPQRDGADYLAAHCCVMAAVGVGEHSVFFGFVDGETLLHVLDRRIMIAKRISTCPGGMMRLHPQHWIINSIGNLE